MKNFILVVSLFCLSTCLFAQTKEADSKYQILLTGASFASPENGWFELACKELNALPINKAVGGDAIANTANRMIEGTLYSREQLENLDALVIMQVHDQDVFNEAQLKEDYHDYQIPFDRSNYAAAFDYVIKRYTSECYELKNDPASRYYKTKSGKPAVIVLCTDWQDARVVYNSTVRLLAAKWGLPVVEFDTNIGFSRNQAHPVTKEQYSLIFSMDTQEIGGVKYGWHPLRGKDSYIQQRMAAIFVHTMKEILPLR